MASKKKTAAIRSEEIELHGHCVSYRTAGEGPVVLLIHGIAGSSEQWIDSMSLLAEGHTVIAPDLLGHGRSAKPRGDYSLGAYAAGLRDLLVALGHRKATVVGHSLGGGIALQFSYQFPERSARLVLVSSGGLEVFDGAGHFPQLDEPLRFARTLSDFIESTEPADVDADSMRARMV